MKNKGKKISFLLIIILLILFLGLLLLSPGNQAGAVPNEAFKTTEVDIEIVDDVKLKKPSPTKVSESVETEKKSEAGNGVLPPLHANYREFLGFAKYASAMERAGGRFFIISQSMKKILRIDFSRDNLYPVSVKSISGRNFSPRTRVISDEPALLPMIKKAQRIYGISRPEVILLVPRKLENKIALRVSDELSQKGSSIDEVSALYGHYMVRNGTLALNISRAQSIGRKGLIKMNLNIYL